MRKALPENKNRVSRLSVISRIILIRNACWGGLYKVSRMNSSFKFWGTALACGVGAFVLASVLFIKGWFPVNSQAEVVPVQVSTQPVPVSAAPVAAVAVPATAAAPAPAAYTQAQIDQWVAPVALYPDTLLSQVLMASTYPTNVIQAEQWSRDHPQLQGDAAVKAAASEPWDPSVKSLVAFPQLLALMGEDPVWVQNLGNLFLAQPADLIDSVQKFRQIAQKSGALKSTPQQKVTVKPAATGNTTVVNAAPQTIIIESADPQVVYVPSYNPNVVYGTWPTPAYPPVYLPPPPGEQFVNGVVSGIGFGVGVAATYAIFGNIDWDDDHHHDDGHHDDGHHGGQPGNFVNVNVNNYNRITGNNDHISGNSRMANHSDLPNSFNWQHNPAYNTGVPNPVAHLSGATQNQALNRVAQRSNYRGFDAATTGQTREQRRQQAASVMNSHEGRTATTAPRSVPSSNNNLANRAQVNSGSSRQMPAQYRNHQQMQNSHPGNNMNLSHSSVFSGNSSRSPSWQQQQARGNQSRQQMHDVMRSRPANAEPVHLHRR